MSFKQSWLQLTILKINNLPIVIWFQVSLYNTNNLRKERVLNRYLTGLEWTWES